MFIDLNMTTRGVLGLKYLRKECLQYELRIRGESDEGSAGELAQRLRGVVEKPVNIDLQTVGEVSSACAACSSLLAIIQEGITLVEGAAPTRAQLARLHALVDHVSHRIADIGAVNKEAKFSSNISRLRDEVWSVQQQVVRLSISDESEVEPGRVQEEGRGVARAVEMSGQFSKLPNPLLPVIQGIRELSLRDIDRITEVLWLTCKLQDQAEVSSLSHEVIFQVIYPLADGRLRRLITKCKREGGSLKELRQGILAECLGVNRRKDLADEHYYRVQAREETLGDYIERVREARIALCVEETEGEAVTRILDGMKPEDRLCVMFADKPHSFSDLDNMVKKLEEVKYGDEKRGEGRAATKGGRGSQGDGAEGSGSEFRRRRCFRCGSFWHLVKNCKEPSERRTNS